MWLFEDPSDLLHGRQLCWDGPGIRVYENSWPVFASGCIQHQHKSSFRPHTREVCNCCFHRAVNSSCRDSSRVVRRIEPQVDRHCLDACRADSVKIRFCQSASDRALQHSGKAPRSPMNSRAIVTRFCCNVQRHICDQPGFIIQMGSRSGSSTDRAFFTSKTFDPPRTTPPVNS